MKSSNITDKRFMYQKASILTGLGNTKPSHIKLGINSCRTKSIANSIPFIILIILSSSILLGGCKTTKKDGSSGSSMPAPDLNGDVLTTYWMDMDTFKPSPYVSARGKVKTGPDGKVNPNNLVKTGIWKQYFNASVVYGKKTSKRQGPLQGKGSFTDGKRDGEWVFYALSKKGNDPGPKQSVGRFAMEKRVGTWKTLFPDGKTQSERNYISGKIQGQAKTYFRNGKVFKIQTYKDSIQNGPAVTYHSNGKIKEKVNYKNGEKDGLLTKYHKNGKISSLGKIKMGLKYGKWIFNHNNDRTSESGSYQIVEKMDPKTKQMKKKGVRQGKWIKYYKSGKKKATGRYESNKEAGLWAYYTEKGVHVADYTVKGGMIFGFCRIYDKRGRKIIGEGGMMGQPFNTKKNGKWRDIGPNGKPNAEGTYMMNKKNQAWTFYYPNGKVKIKGSYMMDKKNGKWTEYDKKGNVIKTENWMMGRLSKF